MEKYALLGFGEHGKMRNFTDYIETVWALGGAVG